MKQQIVHAKIVLADRILEDGVCCFENGCIGYVGTESQADAETVLDAKGCWLLHNIPDVWQEKIVKTHPHAKPLELQKQLILATTQPGDTVLDPAAGGYSVLEACRQTGRDFIGGDIAYGED